MTTFYIVRHGNTFEPGETPTRVGQRTDLDLVTKGREQAQALGRHFAEQGIQFDRAYTSPLKRTRQTTDLLMHELEAPCDIQTQDFLREIDYGVDENMPEPDVVARVGEDAIKRWETDAIVPDGWLVDPTAIQRDWQTFFSEHADHGNVLVVTSNGIARFALYAALEEFDTDIKLRTGSYGMIETHNKQATLKCWNQKPAK